MEVDDSNWPEVAAALTDVPLDDEATRALVGHLANQLVSHFGAEHFDVWRFKEGLHRHDAAEVAAVAIIKLAPVLAELPADALPALVDAGEIGASVRFPWDETHPFG